MTRSESYHEALPAKAPWLLVVKITPIKLDIKKSSWQKSHLNNHSYRRWQKSLSMIKIAKG